MREAVHHDQLQRADDLAAFLRDLDPEIPVFPMGVGSNLIVRDGGLRAVVIRLGRGFNQIEIEGDTVTATYIDEDNGQGGYFIEVTQSNSGALTEPSNAETFRHRQTMANAMRVTTAELGELGPPPQGDATPDGENQTQGVSLEAVRNL